MVFVVVQEGQCTKAYLLNTEATQLAVEEHPVSDAVVNGKYGPLRVGALDYYGQTVATTDPTAVVLKVQAGLGSSNTNRGELSGTKSRDSPNIRLWK